MRFLIVLLLFPLPCGGCQLVGLVVADAYHMSFERATTPRVEKRFRVLDAERHVPVEGAQLVVIHNFDWKSDWVIKGITDANGVAELELAEEYLHLARAKVAAKGYLNRDALYFGDARKPGTGKLSDEPTDIYLYRQPAAKMGLRIPAGFLGSFVFRLGESKSGFPFPPSFPVGKRVWWTVVEVDQVTVVELPPPLGGIGWNGSPIGLVARDGEQIPIPEPGAEVEGVAAWQIGVRMPNGPWGVTHYVMVIGDREAALAKAQEEWKQHGNGEAGFIYNGWLKLVAPKEVESVGGGAYGVSRKLPPGAL